MDWHGRIPPVRMPKLLVRATLANLDEPKHFEDRDDLARGFRAGSLPILMEQ
jgi:hypothetical protein